MGFYDHSEDDVIDGPYTPVMHALKENDVIHLGGRDACSGNTPLISSAGSSREKAAVTGLLHTAEKIESLHPYYDRNYNGHIGYAHWITRMVRCRNV